MFRHARLKRGHPRMKTTRKRIESQHEFDSDISANVVDRWQDLLALCIGCESFVDIVRLCKRRWRWNIYGNVRRPMKLLEIGIDVFPKTSQLATPASPTNSHSRKIFDPFDSFGRTLDRPCTSGNIGYVTRVQMILEVRASTSKDIRIRPLINIVATSPLHEFLHAIDIEILQHIQEPGDVRDIPVRSRARSENSISRRIDV